MPYLGRSSDRRSPIRWPRPTASTHSGKSREFATPLMWNVPTLTFPAAGNGTRRPTRSPMRGKTKDGQPVKVTYHRSQATGVPEDIDANFLNDQYWLLLPFHVIWDTSATVTNEGMQKLPLGNRSGEKLMVKYPSEGGYSPGDTWDVYVGVSSKGRRPSFFAIGSFSLAVLSPVSRRVFAG